MPQLQRQLKENEDITDLMGQFETISNDTQESDLNENQDITELMNPIEDESLLSSAYKKATTRPEIVQKAAKFLGDKIEGGPVSLSEAERINKAPKVFGIPLDPKIARSYYTGALEGASQFLNPLDVITTLTGLGALKTGSKALKAATQIGSAPIALHGASNLLGGDKSLEERGQGLAELAGGSLGMYFPSPKGKGKVELSEVEIANLLKEKKKLNVDEPEIKLKTEEPIIQEEQLELPIPKTQAQEFIQAVKEGKVEKGTTFEEFKKTKVEETPKPEILPQLKVLENKGDGTLYIEFDKNTPVTEDNIKSMFPNRNINISEFKLQPEHTTQRFRIDALDETGKVNPKIGNQIESELGGSFSEPVLKPAVNNYIEALKTGKISKDVKYDEFTKVKEKILTVDNAPPNQRAKMFRGAHDPVEVLFLDSESRELFGAGQSLFKQGMTKPGQVERFRNASERVSKVFNIPVQEARHLVTEYNKKIRELGKAMPREGGDFTAPSFDDFVSSLDSNIKKPLAERLKSETGELKLFGKSDAKQVKEVSNIRQRIIDQIIRGGRLDLNSIMLEAGKKGINKKQFGKIVDEIIDTGAVREQAKKIAETPRTINSAVNTLFKKMEEAIPLRAQQAAINRSERGRQISAFLGVKEGGMKGASKSLSAMKGEFEKVPLSPMNEIDQIDLNLLFDEVKKTSRITDWERPVGIKALFNLIDGGPVPPKSQLEVLDQVFGGGFSDRIIELHGGMGMVGIKIAKTFNTMKAAKSALDMSFPLRQGLPLIHRKEYWKSVIDMFGYARSQEKFNAGMKLIEERPKYQFGRQSGLFLADIGSLKKGEEAYANNYLHDLSELGKTGKVITLPYRASERAAIGFLNELRAGVFDNMTSLAEKMGYKMQDKIIGKKGEVYFEPTKEAKSIARFVNVRTGRGGLGKYGERIAVPLNAAFWSPKLASSRIEILFHPNSYVGLPKGMRQEAIKSLAATAGFIGIVNGLGYNYFEGKVSLNPISSDFMKSRYGENVQDPGGGFQQVIVAFNRLVQQLLIQANALPEESVSSWAPTSGPYKPNMLSIVSNFLRNKESPGANLIDTLVTFRKDKAGRNIDRFGQEFTWLPGKPEDIFTSKKGKIPEAFSSMFLDDMAEMIEKDTGFAKTLGLGTGNFFGMGNQIYPERKDSRQNQPRLRMRGL